jgi:hypothetical protein
MHPNPAAAYADAVLAVEQLAGPLILPTDGDRRLGKATRSLEEGHLKWTFTLVSKDGDDSAEPLTVLMRRLLGAQLSRHAGAEHNRRQTQEEAEAAVLSRPRWWPPPFWSVHPRHESVRIR